MASGTCGTAGTDVSDRDFNWQNSEGKEAREAYDRSTITWVSCVAFAKMTLMLSLFLCLQLTACL